MAVGRYRMIAALDVGSTKACCFIAQVNEGGEHPVIRVKGMGLQVSSGLKSGAITSMDAAEQTIRAAVGIAERMAGETVHDVFVSLSGGAPASHTVGVELSIAGHAVSENDIARVLEQGRGRIEPGEREVVHAIPVGYTIDGASRVRNPLGLYGDRLGVNIHVVTAAGGPLRNLEVCMERGHLGVSAMVLSPYASALATLVEDEMDLGVTCIDMGGGTTSISIFHGGHLVFADVVPLGGSHVTNDIARGLSTPVAQAERLKTLYGSAIPSPSDEREVLEITLIGESGDEAGAQVPRSVLTGIIRPRVEEILEMVRDSLAGSGFQDVIGRRVVLTGGASQLQGIVELTGRMLNRQVRPGQPIRVSGLAESMGGPAFSTCAGLLHYAVRGPAEARAGHRAVPEVEAAVGRVSRVGRWLKENF